MLLSVNLAPERRALQRPGAEIEAYELQWMWREMKIDDPR